MCQLGLAKAGSYIVHQGVTPVMALFGQLVAGLNIGAAKWTRSFAVLDVPVARAAQM